MVKKNYLVRNVRKFGSWKRLKKSILVETISTTKLYLYHNCPKRKEQNLFFVIFTEQWSIKSNKLKAQITESIVLARLCDVPVNTRKSLNRCLFSGMESGHWNLSFAPKKNVSKILKIISKIYLSCVQLINTSTASTATKKTHIPRVLEYISMEVRKNFLDFLCLQAFLAKDVLLYLVQERKYLVLVNIIFKPNVSCPICIVLQEALKTSNLTYYAATLYCQNWLHLSLKKRIVSYYSTKLTQLIAEQGWQTLEQSEWDIHHKRITGLIRAWWVGKLNWQKNRRTFKLLECEVIPGRRGERVISFFVASNYIHIHIMSVHIKNKDSMNS